jgi:hypothetical protein
MGETAPSSPHIEREALESFFNPWAIFRPPPFYFRVETLTHVHSGTGAPDIGLLGLTDDPLVPCHHDSSLADEIAKTTVTNVTSNRRSSSTW